MIRLKLGTKNSAHSNTVRTALSMLNITIYLIRLYISYCLYAKIYSQKKTCTTESKQSYLCQIHLNNNYTYYIRDTIIICRSLNITVV